MNINLNTKLNPFSRITIIAGGFENANCVKDWFTAQDEYTIQDCVDIVCKTLNVSVNELTDMRIIIMVEEERAGAIYKKTDGSLLNDWQKIGTLKGYGRSR